MNYIFDFDSTIISLETLDELANISLQTYKKSSLQKISKITQNAMNGIIPFSEALSQRVKLINANQKHIDMLIKNLKNQISKSMISNLDFFSKNKNNIYIISGGFYEIIIPVVSILGIKNENVFANRFIYDNHKNIIGFDKKETMSKNTGKVDIAKNLNLPSPTIVIGDGWTDYQIKESGFAEYFIAYIEHVTRKKIIKNSDLVAHSFNDVLNFIEKL